MIASVKFFTAWVTSRITDDRGASLVEYALLVALIALVCIAALTTLGATTGEKFSEMGSKLEVAGTSGG